MEDNPYVPSPAVITDVKQEYSEVKTYKLRFKDEDLQKGFDFDPGQFVQLSVKGIGEAPISINSSPTASEGFQLCIERKGRVTKALWGMEEGSKVFIRGPYGEGFPVGEATGRSVLCLAGGVGLAPLRSVIDYILDNEGDYGKVQVLYGDKSPECLLFDRHLTEWNEHFDLNVICEEAGPSWTGEEGLITDLIPMVDVDPEESLAFLCGPPIMYKFVMRELEKINFEKGNIYLSLERRMECGIGKCRRCNVGDKFVCKDGPVFAYSEISDYMGKEA